MHLAPANLENASNMGGVASASHVASHSGSISTQTNLDGRPGDSVTHSTSAASLEVASASLPPALPAGELVYDPERLPNYTQEEISRLLRTRHQRNLKKPEIKALRQQLTELELAGRFTGLHVLPSVPNPFRQSEMTNRQKWEILASGLLLNSSEWQDELTKRIAKCAASPSADIRLEATAAHAIRKSLISVNRQFVGDAKRGEYPVIPRKISQAEALAHPTGPAAGDYVWDLNLLGEIDLETPVSIVEVTNGCGDKRAQIESRLRSSRLNPSGKPVIVYAPNCLNSKRESLAKMSVPVASTPEELRAVQTQLERLAGIQRPKGTLLRGDE